MPTSKKKMSPNNYLPKENKNKVTTEDIIIEGDNLDYWKEHSKYIDAAYRWYHDKTKDTKLVLKYKDFDTLFDINDWVFLRYYLNKRKIQYTNTKKGKIIYNMKEYTKEEAKDVIEYILYGDPSVNTPPRVNNVENNNNRLINMRRNERFRDNVNRELTEEEIDALEEAEEEAAEAREEQLLKQKGNAASLKRKTKKQKKYFNLLRNNTSTPYRKGLTRRKKQETYRTEHTKRLMNETKKLFEKLKED